MSALPPKRASLPIQHTETQPQPIEKAVKRKRLTQDHIEALILKAKEDWANEAKKAESEFSSPPPTKKARDQEPTPEPINLAPGCKPPQHLSPETIAYCERLKQKMKEAMEQRQASQIAAINQKWKMSIESTASSITVKR